jgi:hypothetical protein
LVHRKSKEFLKNPYPGKRRMPSANTTTRVADVLHKTVASGLILVSVVGFADVMRGFGVLAKRNYDRQQAAKESPESKE